MAVDMHIRPHSSDLLIQAVASYVVPDPWNCPVDLQVRTCQEMGHGQYVGLNTAEALERSLRHKGCPQCRLVHAHEELPCVIRAPRKGPLDPLVYGDLRVRIGLRCVLLAPFARDKVATVPGEHGHDEDPPRHLRRCCLDAQLVADLEHLEELRHRVNHLSLLILHLLTPDHSLQSRSAHPEVMVAWNVEDAPEFAFEHCESKSQLWQ
mmetsp:Transcript_136434/g.380283  ORF Transcript_136434/g.380283 Transcript_136434/m.380283 type:complete len:208 (-) Transcript_136434:2509-3132(-)